MTTVHHNLESEYTWRNTDCFVQRMPAFFTQIKGRDGRYNANAY
jgi:hypothetical protein